MTRRRRTLRRHKCRREQAAESSPSLQVARQAFHAVSTHLMGYATQSAKAKHRHDLRTQKDAETGPRTYATVSSSNSDKSALYLVRLHLLDVSAAGEGKLGS